MLGPQEDQTSSVWSVHVDLGEGKGMEVLSIGERDIISVARFITSEAEDSVLVLEKACQEFLEVTATRSEEAYTLMLRNLVIDPERGTTELLVIGSRNDLKAIDSDRDLYSEPVSRKVRRGNVTLIEQSGYDLESDVARGFVDRHEG